MKKTYNNIVGLGYNPYNLAYLENICRLGLEGGHHVDRQIKILKKTFVLDVEKEEKMDILLNPLNDTIGQLKSTYKI
jgi:hypothetical protein